MKKAPKHPGSLRYKIKSCNIEQPEVTQEKKQALSQVQESIRGKEKRESLSSTSSTPMAPVIITGSNLFPSVLNLEHRNRSLNFFC